MNSYRTFTDILHSYRRTSYCNALKPQGKNNRPFSSAVRGWVHGNEANYSCSLSMYHNAWNPHINTHSNDNGRLAATIKRILSQIGPAITPPTATAAGQTWQRSGQIAWLFFAARWRLWITHTHSQGVKAGRGKEWQAAEKDFPSHRCLPAAGKLGTEENSAIPGTS